MALQAEQSELALPLDILADAHHDLWDHEPYANAIWVGLICDAFRFDPASQQHRHIIVPEGRGFAGRLYRIDLEVIRLNMGKKLDTVLVLEGKKSTGDSWEAIHQQLSLWIQNAGARHSAMSHGNFAIGVRGNYWMPFWWDTSALRRVEIRSNQSYQIRLLNWSNYKDPIDILNPEGMAAAKAFLRAVARHPHPVTSSIDHWTSWVFQETQ
jgi:hypothetical protein